MSDIVHLKWGDQPEATGAYLLVRRISRVRGDDFYVHRRPTNGGPALDGEARSFASLASALRQAENVAQEAGVQTIYVRMNG